MVPLRAHHATSHEAAGAHGVEVVPARPRALVVAEHAARRVAERLEADGALRVDDGEGDVRSLALALRLPLGLPSAASTPASAPTSTSISASISFSASTFASASISAAVSISGAPLRTRPRSAAAVAQRTVVAVLNRASRAYPSSGSSMVIRHTRVFRAGRKTVAFVTVHGSDSCFVTVCSGFHACVRVSTLASDSCLHSFRSNTKHGTEKVRK